jgi:hypothetical protein
MFFVATLSIKSRGGPMQQQSHSQPSVSPDLTERYWLRIDQPGMPWQRVTRDQFIRAERAAGFRPKFGGDRLATSGFGAGGVVGRVTNGPVAGTYAFDAEFLNVALPSIAAETDVA